MAYFNPELSKEQIDEIIESEFGSKYNIDYIQSAMLRAKKAKETNEVIQYQDSKPKINLSMIHPHGLKYIDKIPVLWELIEIIKPQIEELRQHCENLSKQFEENYNHLENLKEIPEFLTAKVKTTVNKL